MSIDLGYIQKLIKMLSDSSLEELVVQDGEQIIELRKPSGGAVVTATVPQYATSHVVAPAVPSAADVTEPAAAPKTEIKGKAVTSPMVGTFYAAPSPTAKPFVSVGDIISAGQVVCVIEAMKLMNEIESEVSGKVVQICVENGQPVEYGQVLMYVE